MGCGRKAAHEQEQEAADREYTRRLITVGTSFTKELREAAIRVVLAFQNGSLGQLAGSIQELGKATTLPPKA